MCAFCPAREQRHSAQACVPGLGVASQCPMGQGWEGNSATQALPWLLVEVHLAWGGQWSCQGQKKFNDYKGEFNYTLSLTSSGDDGTIIHVIYQQDTCIHNKLKQNVKFQWQLKIQKKKKMGRGVWSRLTHRRMWEQSYGAPLRLKKKKKIGNNSPTVTTWLPSQEFTPQAASKSQTPSGVSTKLPHKGNGMGKLA